MASAGNYYVPEQSKLPIFASLGLFLTVFGAANWINQNDIGPTLFGLGAFVMAVVMWVWFGTVIKENLAGMNSAQLKRSYVWAMFWFIFSEVMFFACFFGALYYLRFLAVPWLAGEGDKASNTLLWEGFSSEWPVLITPDQVARGEEAQFKGATESMGWWSLPFINTVILVVSSITCEFAHLALKKHKKSMFNIWLGLTWILGAGFLVLQAYEYHHAYAELGLTLEAGVYGTTFFLLTGFHGAHVTLGTIMLLIMWVRSTFKGHFKHGDSFGFEAASWYWHFVDVVWIGLFFFVYVFGS